MRVGGSPEGSRRPLPLTLWQHKCTAEQTCSLRPLTNGLPLLSGHENRTVFSAAEQKANQGLDQGSARSPQLHTASAAAISAAK